MKKTALKIKALITAVVLLISMSVISTDIYAADFVYDPDAALEFARSHCAIDAANHPDHLGGAEGCDNEWRCAEFVSECLLAGGLPKKISTIAGMSGFAGKITKYGERINCSKTGGGYVYMRDFDKVLSKGDPIIILYGYEDGVGNGHIALYSGETHSGAIKVYAHNNRQINERLNAKSKTVEIFAVHLYGYKGEEQTSSPLYTNGPVKTARNNGHIYEFYDYSLSRNNAREYCRKHGGELLEINTLSEQKFIEKNIPEGTNVTAYYMGGEKGTDGKWRWASGESLFYHNWLDGEPDSGGANVNSLCFLTGKHSGKWATADGNMFTNVGFINEIDANKLTAGSFIKYEDSRYELFDCSVSWENAKYICEFLGGKLASIANKNEMTILYDMINFNSADFYWIGLSYDVGEKRFKWTDGEAFGYSDWADGAPETANGKAVCTAVMRKTNFGQWKTFADSRTYDTSDIAGFVCEFFECRHTETAMVNFLAPGCVSAGYSGDLICELCGEVIEKGSAVMAFGHEPVKIDGVPKTCTQNGWNDYEYCLRCGWTNYTEIPASHEFGGWITVLPASCLEPGKKERICSACAAEEFEDVPAQGHRDKDGDGVCDLCEANIGISGECYHSCHKNGFPGAIWKIINFFNKLFKVNRYCECGEPHW